MTRQSIHANTLLLLLPVLLLANVASAADEALPAPDARSRLEQPGLITQVAEHTRKLLKLHVENDRLLLDRASWEQAVKDDKENNQNQPNQPGIRINPGQPLPIRPGVPIRIGGFGSSPVEQLFATIKEATGGGSSRATSSNDLKQHSFTGSAAMGVLDIRGDNFNFMLRELNEPRRLIDFSESDNGELSLLVVHPTGDLLRLGQKRTGEVQCTILLDGKVRTFQAESFSRFLRDNGDFVSQELYPLLRTLGVGVPLTVNSPQVRQALLDVIRPIDEQVLAKGRQLIRQLDADDFATREKATLELKQNYERFRTLIEEKLKEKDLSVEARERLEDIVEESAGKNREAEALVRSLDLASDVNYLIDMLPHFEGDDRKVVIAHLQKLTSQPLGDDPDAWRKWRQQQKKDAKEKPAGP